MLNQKKIAQKSYFLNAIEKIKELKVFSFIFKIEPERKRIGIEKNEEFKNYLDAEINYLAIEGIKELNEKIEKMEKKTRRMQTTINKLNKELEKRF